MARGGMSYIYERDDFTLLKVTPITRLRNLPDSECLRCFPGISALQYVPREKTLRIYDSFNSLSGVELATFCSSLREGEILREVRGVSNVVQSEGYAFFIGLGGYFYSKNILYKVRGETLDELFQEYYTFTLQDSGKVISDIGLVLEALEQKQIVHRDIKLENVIYTQGVQSSGGRTTLIDFGLAMTKKGYPDLSPTFQTMLAESEYDGIVGTPGYLTPEQARGELLTTKSDVFAWGILAFELLTRDYAFHIPEIEVEVTNSVGRMREYNLSDRDSLLKRLIEKGFTSKKVVEALASTLDPEPEQREVMLLKEVGFKLAKGIFYP